MPKRIKKNSGFTLIELVIVVAIIGILATAIISGTDFIDQRAQAVDTGNFNIARNLQAAAEQYYIQYPDAKFVNNSLIEKSGNSNVDGRSILNELKNKNILKEDFDVVSNTFTFEVVSGYPQIKFKLTSNRYLESAKTNCVISNESGQWRVPGCGQLK